MARAFIGFFRLVEACAHPGCPVCRCVIRDSHRHLDALLYEQVTDPDTRRAIRASWGFCNWHTWMLLEVEHAIFGSALIYEELVKLALSRTERLDGRADPPRPRGWLSTLLRGPRRSSSVEGYRGRAECPACTAAADTERRYLSTMVASIDDGDLAAAYAQSDGLCVPHLFAVLERDGERREARVLVDRTREKWARLGRELSSFVSKHDYRNREPYTPAEAASSARAFEMLAGARSVFGNDLRASTSTRRYRPSAFST
jgi:hypothetical protein